jgi:hypothetical protein
VDADSLWVGGWKGKRSKKKGEEINRRGREEEKEFIY